MHLNSAEAKSKKELTIISAITRGCLSGLSRKARPLVTTTTKHICKIASGSAKSSGLSPWNTPLDVAFIGEGQVCPAVPFNAIAARIPY